MNSRLYRNMMRLCLVTSLATTGCVKAQSHQAGAETPSAREQAAASLIERAEEYAAVGDNMRAEQYLSAALSRGADEARVVPLLVKVCIADERYRSATQYLEEYLRHHPSQQNARFLLASLHLSLGQTEVARRELEQVLRANPDHAEAHFALATLLRDEDASYAAADAHYREYLRLRPEGAHAEEAQGSLLTWLPESNPNQRGN